MFEVLSKSLKIKDTLQLKSIVLVFDQALYAKAIEIKWKHPVLFKPLVLRMGAFHTIGTLLGIIGKRFQDAGLRDICIESGIIAEGSVSGVLEGKRYNRAVRFHKLLYESLMRAAWPGFQTWLVENHANRKRAADDAFNDVKLLCDGISESKVHEQLGKASFSELQELFHLYLDFLRHNNGKLSTFWMSYFDLVEILLGLLRASREGNWALHLSSIRQMIPWCFAYDNLNYARYFPQRVFYFIFSFISL